MSKVTLVTFFLLISLGISVAGNHWNYDIYRDKRLIYSRALFVKPTDNYNKPVRCYNSKGTRVVFYADRLPNFYSGANHYVWWHNDRGQTQAYCEIKKSGR